MKERKIDLLGFRVLVAEGGYERKQVPFQVDESGLGLEQVQDGAMEDIEGRILRGEGRGSKVNL